MNKHERTGMERVRIISNGSWPAKQDTRNNYAERDKRNDSSIRRYNCCVVIPLLFYRPNSDTSYLVFIMKPQQEGSSSSYL